MLAMVSGRKSSKSEPGTGCAAALKFHPGGRFAEPANCCAVTSQGSADSSICISTGRPDRKSTRLNSSHDQISYAVFCLKKKKIMKSTSHLLNVIIYIFVCLFD